MTEASEFASQFLLTPKLSRLTSSSLKERLEKQGDSESFNVFAEKNFKPELKTFIESLQDQYSVIILQKMETVYSSGSKITFLDYLRDNLTTLEARTDFKHMEICTIDIKRISSAGIHTWVNEQCDVQHNGDN